MFDGPLNALLLFCFIFGLTVSIGMLLMGSFGGEGLDGLDGADFDFAGPHGSDAGDGSHSVRFFSISGIVVFMTWFGGVGLLVNVLTGGHLVLTISTSLIAGLIGTFAVFLFLGKFLARGQTRLDPRDYYLPGTLARVTSTIREGGTGEILYVQGGTRKTAGARSDEGSAIARGEEVMIVRYERGIAYVKSVEDELHQAEPAPGSGA